MPRCEQCGQVLDEQGPSTEPPSRPAATSPPDPTGTEPEQGQRCPGCGAEMNEKAAEGQDEEIHPKAPWHFKVLIVGSVVYLGYRLYQGIGWLIHHA